MSAPALAQITDHEREDGLIGPPLFVIDDDATARQLVSGCLRALGLHNRLVEFADGTSAMAALQDLAVLGPRHLPALVLLDLDMPGMTGIEVLTRMRDILELTQVPVVILSGDDRAANVTRAYSLGAASYLIKPVGFQALGAVVRALPLPWFLA